jgi:hypothetical protein
LIGHIKGWDPRQGGMGSSLTPVFDVECLGKDLFDDVAHAMIRVGSPAQLLTGVVSQAVEKVQVSKPAHHIARLWVGTRNW